MSWDDQIIALGGHFYQSSHWGKFQESQGYRTLVDQGEGWMWQAALRKGRGGINYLYCPYGPVIKSKDSAIMNQALESLAGAGKQHNAVFAKAEPWVDPKLLIADSKPLIPCSGWREVGFMQPKYIMQLDISVAEEQLRNNISQSNRNLINQADVRGLAFSISNDPTNLSKFLDLQKDTAKRAGFNLHSDSYFRKLVDTLMPAGTAHFYFAQHQDGLVAAAICYEFGGVRYYAYAATNDGLNREHKGAIALLWWIIADAKQKGIHTFDYGGVAPDDQPDHPWAGHTRFKKSIGGEIITLPGTWDYPIKPTKYKLYRAVKRLMP